MTKSLKRWAKRKATKGQSLVARMEPQVVDYTPAYVRALSRMNGADEVRAREIRESQRGYISFRMGPAAPALCTLCGVRPQVEDSIACAVCWTMPERELARLGRMAEQGWGGQMMSDRWVRHREMVETGRRA